MRELEYNKLADEVKELQSDMRRLELAAVATVGGTVAFLLKEQEGQAFLIFGSFVPLLITIAAGLRYVAYFYQLKRIRKYLAKKEAKSGYEGWETFLTENSGSSASRLATISSFVFWTLLLVFSCTFVILALYVSSWDSVRWVANECFSRCVFAG